MNRPLLQLHLSTLVIASMLAAALVWLNVRERHNFEDDNLWKKPADTQYHVPTVRGWPMTFQLWYDYHDPGDRRRFWHLLTLVINSCICMAVLAATTVATEWFVRRMKRGAS